MFDASSKSPNGNSLNDCLLLGPRLQHDVFDILIRFRLHQYALSADVAKMYRQVGLDKSDRDFHRILWRDYVTDEIRELRMTHLTYDVASSSYHSTRALQESGKNHGPNPNTVNVILNDFWVDDSLSGADTLEEGCVLKDNLIETLNKNCLPLRKWSSNEPQLVTRAFSCVGLDFAGPLTFKNGTECVKGYVALFICFASKAVHLEAVSSLTSDAMVVALRRFIARRGIPSQIVSDNATNFVGDLNELEKVVWSVAQSYSSIEWLFIPPRSPNFGGLWEAAVKSMKHHLRRFMGNSILTYEEMTSVICQIEQVFNNRPLMTLTNNPDDIFALTPSRLVNGSRSDAIPQPCLQTMDPRGHPAKRFRALQQLLSQFWKRWASEYVASLHPRGKWRQERANLSIDDVVLITDDGIPPLQWSIGRVMQLKFGHHW